MFEDGKLGEGFTLSPSAIVVLNPTSSRPRTRSQRQRPTLSTEHTPTIEHNLAAARSNDDVMNVHAARDVDPNEERKNPHNPTWFGLDNMGSRGAFSK